MMKRAFVAGLSVLLLAGTSRANDWPYWRGPEQTGMTRENAVVKNWSPSGENLLWKSDIGGRTTPIVVDGRVFFNTPRGEGACLQEAVVCLDAETGKPVWEKRFPIFHSDIVENRIGWTAPVADPESKLVYVHLTSGEFVCLDRDGKLVWKVSLTEEFNRVSGYGGRLHTPIIDEERVIVSFLNTNWANQAKPMHRYVAFNKKTGAVIWWSEPGDKPEDTTYAVPFVAVIGGKRMLVASNADGNVYGMLARTGQRVWRFDLSKRGLNSSPVVDGDRVFVCHSEENLDSTVMGRMVCIDATKTGNISKTGELWRFDGLDAGYASPAVANGRVYVVDNSANLFCLDTKTGKEHWRHSLGRVGKGSPIVTADGVIYVAEQNGVFHVLKDAGEKCESLSAHEFKLPDNFVDEMFGSPAFANGRVYFMARSGTYCLGAKSPSTAAIAIPPMPAEKPGDAAPATLLVTPGEITLAPGASQKFELLAYNASGAATAAPQAAEWSAAGVRGTISADGTLVVGKEPVFSAGLITAKAGSLTATARVRVSPAAPFKMDFEKVPDDKLPGGWVGIAGKTKVAMRDGSKVFCKLAEKGKPSPVWKLRAYSGPPLPIGQTVECDILGAAARKRFKPDMGVINGRYELILMGMTKELELSRWRDEPNFSLRKRVPFEMKTDVWYRFKLRIEPKGSTAMLLGKVWPRGEPEPAAWSIEVEDSCPIPEGSPGLFAYSNGTTEKSDGAETFYDNFQVTPNE